ncbi:MAG: S-methyl-5-thioribose-1-phosphate isomerase [Planctomycetota bacterium]
MSSPAHNPVTAPTAALAPSESPAIRWRGGSDGVLQLLDQTRLPETETWIDCNTVQDCWYAIKRLAVRGAPAIGIAAAYGVVLSQRDSTDADAISRARAAADHLGTSRPTAVNLFWALDRIRGLLNAHDPATDGPLRDLLLAEAIAIHEEDRQLCIRIGQNGASLLQDAKNVITHCNAGGLATAQWGTATAPIYQLHQNGSNIHVYADETRPLLQGARLTAYELSSAGIPVTVITDSMAGSVMRRGESDPQHKIDAVIVGADRVTANGDVANKIGTFPLAVLARHHNIPFYVALPVTTFDLSLPDGSHIPIEERERGEISCPHGTTTVPSAASVYNPAFDVTPAELVTALVTDAGIVHAPNEEKIRALLS